MTKHIAANTARISLVLSRWNLTPTSTPVITMATTASAHVTPMITCFRVTRDLSPPVDLPISSAYNLLSSYKRDRLCTTRTITITLPVTMDGPVP